jgi:hypothetical protein
VLVGVDRGGAWHAGGGGCGTMRLREDLDREGVEMRRVRQGEVVTGA